MILEEIPEGSLPTREEFFGPIFCLNKITGNGIEQANASDLGLGASVSGIDLEEADKVAL